MDGSVKYSYFNKNSFPKELLLYLLEGFHELPTAPSRIGGKVGLNSRSDWPSIFSGRRWSATRLPSMTSVASGRLFVHLPKTPPKIC